MQLIDQIKAIEKYICEYFEDWGLDDPIEEAYLADYQEISGASQEALSAFEEKFHLTLPDDFKRLYQYKNGSKYLSILPSVIDEAEMTFCLMSLQEIENIKQYFQNKDALLTAFSDYFTSDDIEAMRDSRIKPYLFNQKWLPFAQYCDSCYLMLDFDPDQAGKEGQVLCYSHDPDRVVYVASSIGALINEIMGGITEQ
jgi:hypothetical protein